MQNGKTSVSILYQDNILNYINNTSLEKFPHTVLITGPKGSGKHSISQYISSRFNLELIDLTDKLTLETIDEIYLSTQMRFYLIDSDKISIKEQNIILKFLEEPNNLTYILILNSFDNLLDTVKNRCFCLILNKYTKDQLKTFLTGSELILNVSETPGDIIAYQNNDFLNMVDFINKIFLHIKTANLSNCLTISDKISFDGKDESKYDVDIFCKLLLFMSKNISPVVYELTNQLCRGMAYPNSNKRMLLDSYIVNLKYII